MNKQYLDTLHNDATNLREDREFVAEQYNKKQEEKFKHRVADNFKFSHDQIMIGMFIGMAVAGVFKVWAIWSIVSFIIGI